ncbi:MAG: ATP-binding cassette domain-containing protein [Methylococcaceae bacterium]|nr:ATP-binding cassette domain-containing protein [Methylococcaceae bacterium]
MSVVLSTQDLSKRLFGEVPVTLVEAINLSMHKGEFVCIMGPSGSGKSSLLYLLGLLDIPSQGKIWLDGEDTSSFGEDELAKRRLEKLGFVFQFHFLLAEFTVLENVALPMRRLGGFSELQIRERALQLLERLDVAKHANKWPHQISGLMTMASGKFSVCCISSFNMTPE